MKFFFAKENGHIMGVINQHELLEVKSVSLVTQLRCVAWLESLLTCSLLFGVAFSSSN